MLLVVSESYSYSSALLLVLISHYKKIIIKTHACFKYIVTIKRVNKLALINHLFKTKKKRYYDSYITTHAIQ